MTRRKKFALHLRLCNGSCIVDIDYDKPTTPEWEARLDQMFEEVAAANNRYSQWCNENIPTTEAR